MVLNKRQVADNLMGQSNSQPTSPSLNMLKNGMKRKFIRRV